MREAMAEKQEKAIRWTREQILAMTSAQQERVEKLLFDTAAEREEKITGVLVAAGIPCDTPAIVALIVIAAHAAVCDEMFDRAQFVKMTERLWDLVVQEGGAS